MTAPLFSLGRLVATPAALALLANAGVSPADLLVRHQSGDWGEVSSEDARENELPVREGFRIISNYPVGEAGERIWIIIMWNVQPPGSVFGSAVRCPAGVA